MLLRLGGAHNLNGSELREDIDATSVGACLQIRRQMNTVFKPAQMDIQSRLTDIQHAVNTLTYAVDGLYRGSSPMPPLQALDTQLLTDQSLTEQSL